MIPNHQKYSTEYIKLQLERFADQIDNQIQNKLMTEIMIKYSQLSKQFESKNKLLVKAENRLLKYNIELEEIVNKKVAEISESQIATIYALVKLAESRDDDTGTHIERTSMLCKLMAQYLSILPEYKEIITADYIENIYKASPLHDIGKVGIPDSILLKPGKLTKEEFDIMKSHTTIGYKTLSEVQRKYKKNGFIKMGMEIAKYHHEKWDGTGYPIGLSGNEIPVSARIMAIVDVYDALRSKRVYKEGFSHEKACEIIKEGREKHFDPVLVDVFLENNERFRDLSII
jgi:putative two-component system response regulator